MNRRTLALAAVLAVAGTESGAQASIPAAIARAPCPVAGLPTSPEVAFEPERGAEALILKVIDRSVSTLRLSAYAFSAPPIVEALMRAKGRGVDVQVVVDGKHNIDEDPKRIGRNALDALVKAGIPTRTNRLYRIHHDKFIVADACHVETGSYNYAESAKKDSENVLVVWNDPALAARYLAHWQARFDEGEAYREVR